MAPRPIHRDQARKVLIGTGTLLAFIAVGWVGAIVQTGGALPGRSYTYVTAMFTSVGTLDKGKPVKQDGLQIGQVSGIKYLNGQAAVTLRLDGSRKVYKNASAAVDNSSALGKKYVAFEPGTAAAGDLGSQPISAARTTAATSLEDILSFLDPKTRASLQTALNNLGQGTVGQSDNLHALLTGSPQLLNDISTLTQVLAQPNTQLPALLQSADQLAHRFDGRQAQIAALMENAAQTLKSVATDKGAPLEQTVAQLPAALTSAKSALDALYAPLGDAQSAVQVLRPGAAALGAATPNLRAFLRDSTGVLARVPNVAQIATPTLSDLTRTVSSLAPLIPNVSSAFQSLAKLLVAFAPYSGDAGRFFSQNALLSGTLGTDSQHYFAAQLTGVGLFSIAGVPDPLYRKESYPCPGTAWNHATVTNCKAGVR